MFLPSVSTVFSVLRSAPLRPGLLRRVKGNRDSVREIMSKDAHATSKTDRGWILRRGGLSELAPSFMV